MVSAPPENLFKNLISSWFWFYKPPVSTGGFLIVLSLESGVGSLTHYARVNA